MSTDTSRGTAETPVIRAMPVPLREFESLDHVHDPGGRCHKNRFGARCTPNADEREAKYAAAVIDALVPWLRNVFGAVEDASQRKVAMEVIDCIDPLVQNPDHFAPVMAVVDQDQAELRAEVERLREDNATWWRRAERAGLRAENATRAMEHAESAEARVAALVATLGKVREHVDQWAAFPDGQMLDAVMVVAHLRRDLKATSKEPQSLEVDGIAEMARDFSQWLNSTYPTVLSEEAVFWRRVGKIHEEAGEVREASGAYWHENPRKSKGSVDDVIKELADCVGASLGAIEHLTGHEGRSLEIATTRFRYVCARVGVRDADPMRVYDVSPGAFIEVGPVCLGAATAGGPAPADPTVGLTFAPNLTIGQSDAPTGATETDGVTWCAGVHGRVHNVVFDGDDPYTKCTQCGEIRDALTGRVVKAGEPS